VYKATDELLRRPVVVKVMRAEGRWNHLLRARFEQEMRALARIDHPGVVGVLDVGELEDGSPFLVIQHIPGISLREALRAGPLAVPKISGILRQMGAALRAAHAAEVAHRDLKPENVMLQPRENGGEFVKLIDFGIAKIDKSGSATQATTVMLAGTVRYMAPEQFDGRNSAASDLYSMALVACELLSGHPDLRALPKKTSRATRAALESALSFRPEDRPRDAQAWSEQFAGTLDATPARRRAMAALVVLAALLTGVAGVLWLLRNSANDVRIVEKVGAFDPLWEGFQTHNEITGTVAENAAHTGYDGWRILTPTQGYYFHPFTSGQKRRALDRGWKLTAVIRADEGGMNAGADFTGADARFNVNIYRDGNRESVQLLTQIVPERQGPEISQSPPGVYHRYELLYDPSLRSASLRIDGELKLTGYRGCRQFLEDRGLNFGGAVFKSDRASGSFQSVRFEINP